LHNDLAEGRYMVEEKPVAISEITAPIFAVSTETDHVAPWRSVYKIHLLNEGEVTFVLTSGGHNAGIVSEPGHSNPHFRIAHRAPNEPYLAADSWEAVAEKRDGSWWPSYVDWLGSYSTARTVVPPLGTGNYPVLGDAPGIYVRER
jgi:polyhydroxyalkanoate synthase